MSMQEQPLLGGEDRINPGSVQVVGGPLDGHQYDLKGAAGELIELNSAAGVCVYQFAQSDNDELILHYIRPASPRKD